MKIDMWLSHGNDNLEGVISFVLVSGKHRQLFKRSWTVINYRPNSLESMKKEMIRCLFDVRLKELLTYLYKQIDDQVVSDGQKLYPLDPNWSIE